MRYEPLPPALMRGEICAHCSLPLLGKPPGHTRVCSYCGGSCQLTPAGESEHDRRRVMQEAGGGMTVKTKTSKTTKTKEPRS